MGLRTLFLGTPEAAVPTLRALASSRHELLGAVTGGAKPRGRGLDVSPTPVAQAASDLGVKILEVRTLREPATVEALATFDAEVFVVAAFGFLLPPNVLKTPRLGCVNVHFSRLPAFRGAAPVQWALIEGLERTGVTIIQMDEGLDTGPIFDFLEEEVLPHDTAGSLGARLAVAGGRLLVSVLDRLEKGGISATPQPDRGISMAPKITTDSAEIDWTWGPARIERWVRAMDPRPGAWTTLRGKRLKVWRASVASGAVAGPPGSFTSVGTELHVAAGGGSVRLDEVQMEGKRRIPADEFLHGLRPDPAGVLGT